MTDKDPAMEAAVAYCGPSSPHVEDLASCIRRHFAEAMEDKARLDFCSESVGDILIDPKGWYAVFKKGSAAVVSRQSSLRAAIDAAREGGDG